MPEGEEGSTQGVRLKAKAPEDARIGDEKATGTSTAQHKDATGAGKSINRHTSPEALAEADLCTALEHAMQAETSVVWLAQAATHWIGHKKI